MTPGAVEQPRRYDLALFVLLAFAISWAMHIPLALATLGSGDPTASTGSPLNLLAPWGPAVAAIIVTAVVMGRRGPGTPFRQLRVWRVGIRWYLIAVLLPAGLWLAGWALDALLGRGYQVESVATDPDLRHYLAGFLIAAFIYTLGEELGWRAYALPRLQEHRTALMASIVIGVLWGLWHVPTFIAQGHTGMDLVPLAVSPIAASVLLTCFPGRGHDNSSAPHRPHNPIHRPLPPGGERCASRSKCNGMLRPRADLRSRTASG